MKIFAYCDKRYEQATRKVLGWDALLLTSPPIFTATLYPEWFEGHDFLYIDLHGQPHSVYLYSGEYQEQAALSVSDVEMMKLNDTIVFITACFLPETKFVETFLEVGARAVIGGYGENYGGKRYTSGAQSLAKEMVSRLKKDIDQDPGIVLEQAKNDLRISIERLFRPRDTVDALEFGIWRS